MELLIGLYYFIALYSLVTSVMMFIGIAIFMSEPCGSVINTILIYLTIYQLTFLLFSFYISLNEENKKCKVFSLILMFLQSLGLLIIYIISYVEIKSHTECGYLYCVSGEADADLTYMMGDYIDTLNSSIDCSEFEGHFNVYMHDIKAGYFSVDKESYTSVKTSYIVSFIRQVFICIYSGIALFKSCKEYRDGGYRRF